MERDFLRTLAEHAKSIMREEDLKTRLTMVRNFCGMVEEEMQRLNGMMKAAAFVNECQIRGNRNDVRAAFSKEMRQITQRLEDWVKDYNERPNIRNFSKDTFVIPTIRERCNSYVVLVFCINFRKFEKSVDKNRFKRANGRFFFEECYKLAMAVSNYVKLEYFVKPATRRHMRETIVEHTRSKAPGKPMGDVKTKAFKTKREVEACEDLRYCMITDLFYLLTLYAATRNECEFLETEAELRGEPQPEEEKNERLAGTSETPTQETQHETTETPDVVAMAAVSPKKGKQKSFRDIIQYYDPERLLERLHQLIDGKRGADVGSVLLKALEKNYLTRRPTQKEFESEFKLIGTWGAISNYMADTDKAYLRANRIVIFE